MEAPSSPGLLLGIIALGALGIALLLVNTGFTVLKENPLFWRNTGGYPLGLREIVLLLYYPVLGFNCLLCVIYSGLTAWRQPISGRASRWTIGGAVVLWSLWFLNVGLLTANNLENILEAKPVHYHAALPGQR